MEPGEDCGLDCPCRLIAGQDPLCEAGGVEGSLVVVEVRREPAPCVVDEGEVRCRDEVLVVGPDVRRPDPDRFRQLVDLGVSDRVGREGRNAGPGNTADRRSAGFRLESAGRCDRTGREPRNGDVRQDRHDR